MKDVRGVEGAHTQGKGQGGKGKVGGRGSKCKGASKLQSVGSRTAQIHQQ